MYYTPTLDGSNWWTWLIGGSVFAIIVLIIVIIVLIVIAAVIIAFLIALTLLIVFLVRRGVRRKRTALAGVNINQQTAGTPTYIPTLAQPIGESAPKV